MPTAQEPDAESPDSPCASIERAPLTCRQALAALLHRLAEHGPNYPHHDLASATLDAYRALGEAE